MNDTTAHTSSSTSSSATSSPSLSRAATLTRPVSGRMLAGVAAGLAEFLGIDVAVIRVVLAVLAVAGGAAVPLYLAGWLLIPEEGAEKSLASEILASLESHLR